MMGPSRLLVKVFGAVVLAASPQLPVAVVEQVTGNPAGIQFMDYVEPGQVIELGSQGSIVLGYLKSCWRETIVGGTVTVGAEQSEVQGGKIDRTKVMCAGSNKVESAGGDTSGGMVFRKGPHSAQPQLTLYGLSPIVEVNPASTLIIERVDRPNERHEIVVRNNQLVHGAFLDLASANVVLTAGGIYRAKAGAQEVIFKINRDAKAGQVDIVSRLLRLQPKM